MARAATHAFAALLAAACDGGDDGGGFPDGPGADGGEGESEGGRESEGGASGCPEPVPCAGTDECEGGMACIEGHCLATCESEDDCDGCDLCNLMVGGVSYCVSPWLPGGSIEAGEPCAGAFMGRCSQGLLCMGLADLPAGFCRRLCDKGMCVEEGFVCSEVAQNDALSVCVPPTAQVCPGDVPCRDACVPGAKDACPDGGTCERFVDADGDPLGYGCAPAPPADGGGGADGGGADGSGADGGGAGGGGG